MAVSQSLTVTEVAGSASVATNESQVNIVWQSTQSGSSYNANTRTAYYWISINGGAETKYSVSYTLPQNKTKTILNKTITVPHKDDGSGTVDVRTEMDTRISTGVVKKTASCTLTTIARASAISSAANVTLGNKCSVKWTPKSAAFYYKMGFQLGDWKYSTEVVRPNRTTEYTYTGLTIPLEVANQISSSKTSGTMYVYLHTFSDSAGTVQIGNTSSAIFTVTIPNNSSTQPTASMTLSPVSTLGSDFTGLYIQGKSKVKATLSSKGKYGATIKSYSMKVNGATYGSGDSYTSGYLTTAGGVTVYGYATDSRGHTGSTSEDITVIAYSKPKILDVVAARCDADGNLADNGTYLKIIAKRSYSPVKSGDVQKNFCQIRYRYKLASASSYSAWTIILAKDNLTSDQVETGALLGGVLSVASTYHVQVQAIDDIGETADTIITIPTDTVYWHRDGARNALGLGKYNERDNAVDSAWDFYMNDHKVTGLPTPEDPSDAVPLGFLQDYIVEHGTSDTWTYRKWSSGLAELWGYGSATYENGNVLAKELVYPFALTSALCGIGTLNSYGGNTAQSLPWNLKLAYGPTACKIWVHNSGGGFAANSTVEASVYIMGRWK